MRFHSTFYREILKKKNYIIFPGVEPRLMGGNVELIDGKALVNNVDNGLVCGVLAVRGCAIELIKYKAVLTDSDVGLVCTKLSPAACAVELIGVEVLLTSGVAELSVLPAVEVGICDVEDAVVEGAVSVTENVKL